MADLVVIGDVLRDVDLDGRAERLAPDAPVPVVDGVSRRARPGGAGLAAVLAARAGHRVRLVGAFAADAAGDEVVALLRAEGVELVAVGRLEWTVTKTRVRVGDRPVLRLDDGDAVATPLVSDAAVTTRAVDGCGAVLVADYGRGVAALDGVRAALRGHAAAPPVVWDPHPRGTRPVRGVVVTPNRAEVGTFSDRPRIARAVAHPLGAVADEAERLARDWAVAAVVVTMGEAGAVLARPGAVPVAVPPPAVHRGDPCGAGDAFAAALAGALARGGILPEAVAAAVEEAGRFVADGGAGAVVVGREDEHAPVSPGSRHAHTAAERVIAKTRARGGIVVGTSGCFDLLHAGHVASLRAARALGDCLVVALNSDASVQRLKGASRPLNPAADRAAVLLALDVVDAVEVFDDDTPIPLLERWRADLFVKGGDYRIEELPEAAALAAWGGRAVVVPYLDGRSTTRMVEEIRGGS